MAGTQGGLLIATNLIDAALADPYRALSFVLGDTLHPGGRAATRDLLDRAQVTAGTRLVDLGCGAGAAGQLARDRGAAPIGLDQDATAQGAAVCGTLERLPFADDSVDVVLSECAICLAEDLDAALSEASRVTRPGGRLAVSDVTLEGPIDALPSTVAHALCLTGERRRQDLEAAIEAAGFTIVDVGDHHEDLLEMREAIQTRVDYEGLLEAMGPRGRQLLEGIRETEAALEAGELGYVSIVAEA